MDRIISYLLQKKYITEQQLQQCLQIQQHHPKLSLCQILVHHNIISSEKLQQIISQIKSSNGSHNRFGKYLIHERLGQGGMGTVYRAVDTNLQREVALKVLNNYEITDKQLKRFKREAVLMANLSHPNIIKVFEASEKQGRPFIAMELIEGRDLSYYMTDFNLVQKVHILIKVAEAIHFAHTQGVIHRDLKPENIMINHQYQPMVMDFGLAKELDGEKLSRTGESAGTPLYMSPEQINGTNVDVRTDVYSLGIILYEMMVGKTPFAEQSSIYSILICEAIPPRNLDKELPKSLEAICLKAIEKKKSTRYQTVKDFAQDLKNYLAGYPISAKPFTVFTKYKKWFLRKSTLVFMIFFTIFISTIIFSWAALKMSQAKLSKEKLVAYKARLKSYRDRLENQIILVQRYSMAAEHTSTKKMLEKMQQDITDTTSLLSEDRLIHKGTNNDVFLEKEIKSLQDNILQIPNAVALHCKYIPRENIYNIDEEHIAVSKNYTFAKAHQPSWKVNIAFDNIENRTYLLWQNSAKKWQKTPFIAVDAYAVNTRKNIIAILQQQQKSIALFYVANGVVQPIDKYNSFINALIKNTHKNLSIFRFHFSSSARWFFVQAQTHSLLFDLKNLQKYDFILPRSGMATFSDDEQYLVTTDYMDTKIFKLSELNKQPFPFKKIIRGGSALCFNSHHLFVGYFDIVHYLMDKLPHVNYVALNAHHKPITSLTMSPSGSFLASYANESGELAIRQSNCETIIAKHFFHEKTQHNSVLLDEDKYGIWQRHKVSIYKRKTNVKEVEFAQIITDGLRELLSLLEKKGYDIQGRHREELGDNFVRFSPNGKFLFHVSLLYLHVYNIKSRKKHAFPLFVLAFRQSHFFRIKQVEIYEDRYVCAIGGKSQLGKEEKMLVIWDLQNNIRIFEKTYSNNISLRLSSKKFLYTTLESTQIKTYELVINNDNVMTQKIVDRNLPVKVKDKTLVEFHNDRMALFSIEENTSLGRDLVVVENNKILYTQTIKIGKASTLKFITQDIIAIGSFFGEVAMVYLPEKKVVKFNLRGVIKQFFFDKKHNALLVYNGLGLNIVPLYYNEEDLFLKKIYPIKLFYNYKTHGICVNEPVNTFAVALTNNFTLLIGK